MPRPVPLLGHAIYLLRNPWDFLARIRPLGDVVRIRLGPSAAYVVNDPNLIRTVLVADAKKYDKGVQFDKLRPVLGNGLVTAAGAEHLGNRRLIQPAFHHSRIAGYAITMRAMTEAKVESWQDGRPVDLDRELAALTMGIVAKTLFSTDLGNEAVAAVLRSMPAVLSGVTKRALSPKVLELLPTAENRRFRRATRDIRTVVDRIIAQYRRDGVDHGDVVSMLILARDEDTGEGLSDTQIRDEVVTMLLAGTETTSNAVSWACHVLGQRPDLEARLHAEVDALAEADGAATSDLSQLGFTRRLITETLRMYPPAWLITRRTNVATTLGGVALPEGASVLLSPYSVHRDPALYADADVFDPDRWLPDRAEQIPRPAFVPFGAGNRQCIGEGFAWAEAAIIISTLARRWRLIPVPGVPVRMLPGATLSPSALPMVAHRRARPAVAEGPGE